MRNDEGLEFHCPNCGSTRFEYRDEVAYCLNCEWECYKRDEEDDHQPSDLQEHEDFAQDDYYANPDPGEYL